MIYYIYKVRRKQTSIRSSRSALTHRYLRYISWNGGRRPQPSTSWVFPPLCRSCARVVFAAVPMPQNRDSCALASASTWRTSKRPPIFPQEKEKHPSSLFPRASHVLFLLCCSAHEPHACRPRPICGRSITSPSAALPQTKNAGPRHYAANPQKRRLLAQENARRHAWLTRSCFGRKNLFIDGPHSLLPFFLSPFLQRKRKKKTEANSAGSNTSLGLTSFVLTMYAIGPSRLVR